MRTDHRLTTFTQADGTSFTVRSALEARWAIFFSELGLRWKYEPTKFTFQNGVYTPDFAVVGLGFIEIKPTLELLISESWWKIQSTSRGHPEEKFFAFCGDRVSFAAVAMCQAGKIYRVSHRAMVTQLPLSTMILNHVEICMNRANRAKLDHFVTAGKVLELEVIPNAEKNCEKLKANLR